MARIAATVVEVRDGRAWLECRPAAGACGACAGGRGCNWRSPAHPRRLEVALPPDGRRLASGDTVELEADETALFLAALRLYLPPLAGLIAGPALLRGFGWDAGALPLLAAVAGLLAGGFVARIWTRRVPPLTLHLPS
jgi:positive regulator of sigma E activity